MKRTIRYISAAVIIAVSIISCGKGFMEDQSFVPAEPELFFEGPDQIEVTKDGGTFSFRFKSNLPWIIDQPADWIDIDGALRGAGSDEFIPVECAVSPNKSLEARSAVIRVWIDRDHAAEMTVTQQPTKIYDTGHHLFVKTGGTGDGSSWDKATTLTEALALAKDATIIHVAAGTYVPEAAAKNTDGNNPGNKAFELSVNATLIGGYPADATDEDTADPEVNPVTLDGENKCYRVLIVSAPKSKNATAKVQGVTITRGNSNGSENLLVNGARLNGNFGAGISVAGADFILENCKVYGNKGKHGPGMFNCDGANTLIYRCSFSDNEASGNGANIWSSYATLTIKDSRMLGNRTSNGVGGAIYIHGDSNQKSNPNLLYCYNTLFKENSTDAKAAHKRGAGIYAREGSQSIVANCTFTGNRAGDGAAIALWGESGRKSSMTIINCTLTGNHSTANGCIMQYAHTTMDIYNSIISGNTADGSKKNVTTYNDGLPDIFSYSIDGTSVYGKDSQVVSGKTFDAATMFSPFQDNVFRLAGTANPAQSMGMPVEELKAIRAGMDPEADSKILTSDQNGKERTGRTMGASVE